MAFWRETEVKAHVLVMFNKKFPRATLLNLWVWKSLVWTMPLGCRTWARLLHRPANTALLPSTPEICFITSLLAMLFVALSLELFKKPHLKHQVGHPLWNRSHLTKLVVK